LKAEILTLENIIAKISNAISEWQPDEITLFYNNFFGSSIKYEGDMIWTIDKEEGHYELRDDGNGNKYPYWIEDKDGVN
jgi:hypothetical protein